MAVLRNICSLYATTDILHVRLIGWRSKVSFYTLPCFPSSFLLTRRRLSQQTISSIHLYIQLLSGLHSVFGGSRAATAEAAADSRTAAVVRSE